jgi:DNA-binding GntR family transcriptional regulator
MSEKTPAPSRIARKSLSAQIRDELLIRIGDGSLAPGTRLIESRIAREFGVSSIPVREAIRELVAMGMLEHGHHKGGWIREVSIPETVQALQVRAALESLAARLAGASLQDRIIPLRAAARQIIEAAGRRDFVAFQKANQAFHREIVEAAGNGILLRMWQTLAFEVRTKAIMDYIAVADPVLIAREHEAVVDAVAVGDLEKAAALLVSHSAHLIDHLLHASKLHPAPPARPKFSRKKPPPPRDS